MPVMIAELPIARTHVPRDAVLFSATILGGSALLFWLEPMFARLVLPTLGGAPAVWNSALLFYQAALFAGYLWAHMLHRWPLRAQVGAQLMLIALAALTLPVAIASVPASWKALDPVVWLPGLFAASIGLIFIAVAAQASLLQSWYARGGRAPWFLYAASNAGSLGALLFYPLLIEPAVSLSRQAKVWSWAVLPLALFTAVCGLSAVRRRAAVGGGERESAAAPAQPIGAALRLRWAALAAGPSGLLIAITSWLTVDVISAPLFWVVPLAIYLLTFILAFSRSKAFSPDLIAPLLIVAISLITFVRAGAASTMFAIGGLLLLFYVALGIHRRLAADAPEPTRATEYYVWIAGGGMAGGLFAALVAPLLFDWTYEQPILLVACAVLLDPPPLSRSIDAFWHGARALPWRYGLPALGTLLYVTAPRVIDDANLGPAQLGGIVLLAAAALLAVGRKFSFAVHLMLLMAATGGISAVESSLAGNQRARSFFGVYRIYNDPKQGVRLFTNGTTLHGAQSMLRRFALRPTTYYNPMSGIGRMMTAVPTLFGTAARIGVVGLGAGTTACWKRPGQDWTFFEIDPAVVAIARDPSHFTYIAGCAPDMRIIIGDARLKLAAGPPARFDVLAVDAFSSDSIPVHLLTREAFQTYGRALAPDGYLMIHISNRFFGLEPVVAAAARDAGWVAVITERRPVMQHFGTLDTTSIWTLLARSPARLEAAVRTMPPGEWRPARARSGFRLWTDDYASVLTVLDLRGMMPDWRTSPAQRVRARPIAPVSPRP